MPTSPEGGRSEQPVVPQLSSATRKRLLAAADEFNRLAPWKWMYDSQITGLRYPANGEILYGSILGRMRSVFALVVYRNLAGHRWLLNTILEGAHAANDYDAFEQDALMAEFALKRELEKEDRAMLAAEKFSPAAKGSRIWPHFRSMVPGAYPWHLNEREADMLIFALPRVAALAELTRQRPVIWEEHRDGDIAFLPPEFDPAAEPLRPEQIEWTPMIPPPDPVVEPITPDEETLARLRKLKLRKGFHLELDLSYSRLIVVAHPERPRYPRLAMAVDRATGFVGGFELSSALDTQGAEALLSVLCRGAEQLGAIPEIICVERARVAAMLEKIARQFEIRVRQETSLPELNAAKEFMEAALRQGRL